MAYIKIENGQPKKYSIAQLKRDNLNISFPDNIPSEKLAEYGVYLLKISTQPSYNPATQIASMGEYYYSSEENCYRRDWIITDKPQEQIDAEATKKLTSWREDASIDRYTFCKNAFRAGILNNTDAEVAARGEWPESFNTALAGLADSDQITEAKIQWAAVTTIRRNAPLLEIVRQDKGVTPEQLDALFQ